MNNSVRLKKRYPFLSLMLVLSVVMISANGRPIISAVGPVLEELRTELSMNSTLVGLLTALPGFCFGFFGAMAPAISRRLGLHLTLTLAMTLLFVGALGRTFSHSVWTFLALTLIALVGIATANVLIPAFVYHHFPNRIHNMTIIYTLAMTGTSSLSSALAAPIAEAIPGGWRGSIGLWGLFALGALIPIFTVWFTYSVKGKKTAKGAVASEKEQSGSENVKPAKASKIKYRFWANPKAIALALFFGIQSMQAYAQFGWIAQIFRDSGMSPTHAGAMLATMQLINVPGGFIAPVIIKKMRHPQILPIILALLLIPGYAGILFSPLSGGVLWVALLAISGFCFPIALLLISTRCDTSGATAELSGFVQGIGYVIAGLGPLIIGAVHASTGGWSVPLWGLIISAPIFGFCGWYAARPGQIYSSK